MNRFLSRLAISSAAILIAAAGGCVALVFLIIALYLGLASVMAPWLAALATAGAALLFSLLVLLIAKLITRRTIAPAHRNRQRSTADLGELLGRQAHDFVAGNSLPMLGILIATGFAMGFSPRLRKFLLKLL
jgi:membrane protein implicated in regulation of membrane protease activity